jgi:hypothetical protein
LIRTLITIVVLSCLEPVLSLVMVSPCEAADILLVRGSSQHTLEEDQIRNLAEFYGLGIEVVDIPSKGGVATAISLMRRPATVAVLVADDALGKLESARTFAALRRRSSRAPLMVYGITEQTDQNVLRLWSSGIVRACTSLGGALRPKVLEVATSSVLTRQLAGMDLPAVASPTCNLQVRPAPILETVLSVREGENTSAPVLVRVSSKTEEVFFVPQEILFDLSWTAKPTGLIGAFSSMAPFVFFLSYAAGDYGWHLDGHYANLTIDDPWLIQPYGPLDYAALVVEMEKHNFHTTIAFIPWNFDRSTSNTVALFRSHGDRLSICMHGNNHAHREFGEYRDNSLEAQIADIKQGIARMERFSLLTGVSYDRLMVFPHGVAPTPTLAALKTYDFLGTANSSNVPLGAPFPTKAMFLLHPYTTAYANLLSLSRYSASGGISTVEVAVQTFLGNPLLFYAHSDLFATGADVFNGNADLVNRVQPDTRWTSLGEIVRHSHPIRRRGDGGFDVRMLSREMDLVNPTGEDREFFIQQEGEPSADTGLLTVDGSPAAFERAADVSILRVRIPGRQVRRLRVAYPNALAVSPEDISKRNVHAYALRMISDFRDLYLSRFSWGKALTRAYYRHNWDTAELYIEKKWWVGIICAAVGVVGIWYRRRKTMSRAAQRATTH